MVGAGPMEPATWAHGADTSEARALGPLTVVGSHLAHGPADRGAGHHDGGGAAVVAHGNVQPDGGGGGGRPLHATEEISTVSRIRNKKECTHIHVVPKPKGRPKHPSTGQGVSTVWSTHAVHRDHREHKRWRRGWPPP